MTRTMTTGKTLYLGPFSSVPFAEGLRALLSQIGSFRVVPISDPLSLSGETREEPAVLLMEGDDPSICRTFLSLDTIRVVVLIDPAEALAFVGVDNPRWTELADVLRAIVEDTETGALTGTEDKVRVLDTDWFSSAVRRTDNLDSESDREKNDFTSIIRWLELRLAWHLSLRGDDGNSGFMGWSVSPRDALYMLVGEALDLTESVEEDLNLQLLDVDNDLFVIGRGLPRTIVKLRDAFDLSREDLRFLLLVLAPEIDGRFATAIGVLQDDLTRRRPGLTLMAELQSDDELTPWKLRRRLNGPDSLVAKGLLRVQSDGLAVDAPIVPGAAVVAYLLADSPERVAATTGATLWEPTLVLEPPLLPMEERLARQLMLLKRNSGPVRLVGGDRSKRWLRRLTSGLTMTMLVGDVDDENSSAERVQKVNDWSVLSRLMDSSLLLLGTDALTAVERVHVAGLLRGRVKDTQLIIADGELSDERGWTTALVLEAPTVSAAERSAWWTTAALQAELHLREDDPDRLAATVPLDPNDYALAVAMAVRQVAAGVDGTLVELVQAASRNLTRCDLPAGVLRIEPAYGWDDIVVSDEMRNLLRSIPQHVLYEGRVMEEWGFAARLAYGRGVAALFSGPSGTGKTMAAQIVAKDLGVDLLQVDLSKTVSKYIGDTEKNLDHVFEAAECSGSVLLFDEADAIFGRRTEIKDAHDRHANVEVAYLLQRLESFRGLTILTTNLKQNIDNAFARRLRFVVDFSLPTAAERAQIWHKAFPQGVLAEGEPDVVAMASRLPIAGGSIQNIALHAAFLAAPENRPIAAHHLFAAIRRELVKMGMRSALSVLDEGAPLLVGRGGSDEGFAP